MPTIALIAMAHRSSHREPTSNLVINALMEKPLDFPKLLQTIQDLLAEPNETRLARMVGKAAPFRYLPTNSPHFSKSPENEP